MAQATVADILDRAADLIEPEGAWTKGSPARTADGIELSYIEDIVGEEAACFCAFGAIERILGQRAHLSDPLNAFCDTIGTTNVGEWNDAPERTQAEVVAKLREAAKLAREQSK